MKQIYGGRVTDDFDRVTITCILNEYFIFNKNQKFFFSTIGYDYEVPELTTLDGFIESIIEIPLNNASEVFGLHSNAEIL